MVDNGGLYCRGVSCAFVYWLQPNEVTLMVAPTRFPSGVQVWGGQAALAEMGLPDQTKYVHFWEDFINAGDFVAATPTSWTRTLIGTGTVAVANLDGGMVLFTNSAADNDAISVQQKNTSFVFTQGRKMFFKARFKLSDVTESDFFMGLSVSDTTPIGGVGVEETGVADGVFFLKIDGSPLLRAFVRTTSVTQFSNLNLFTLTADTFTDIAWFYDGLIDDGNRTGGEIKFFAKIDTDEAWRELGAFRITSFASLTALSMGINMSIQNGEAVAKTMTLDNVMAFSDRVLT